MTNLFSSVLSGAPTLGTFLLSMGVSLALGLLVAFTYMRTTRYTQSFVVTLILLPAMVQMVIMLVNGSVGTGVAVAGAFSLVRFRSVPGNARDIIVIFFAMVIGIATGVGYVAIAAIFALLLCVLMLLIHLLGIGKAPAQERELRITIPESLDYTEIFDDIFAQHAKQVELVQVRTTNMGSLYKLTYRIELLDTKKEKEMIDQLRCRNGNLEISCGRPMLQETL